MIKGVRAASFEKLQLNAGAFLKNFDYSAYTDADALKTAIRSALASDTYVLGLTQGGGTFQATPNIRKIEGDGIRGNLKGATVNDGWDVKLTGTMKEITADNMQLAGMCMDKAVSGRMTTLTLRNDIADADYIPHLIWVGDTSRGAVLIDLSNCLNTTGINMTFTDKGEGTLPFEMLAHSDDIDADEAPVTVIMFAALTVAAAIEVYSVEGATTGKTRIAATPQATALQSYKYKTAATVAMPATGNVLTTGWTAWDGVADITAVDGDEIVVAIVTTSTSACVAAGKAIVNVK